MKILGWIFEKVCLEDVRLEMVVGEIIGMEEIFLGVGICVKGIKYRREKIEENFSSGNRNS